MKSLRCLNMAGLPGERDDLKFVGKWRDLPLPTKRARRFLIDLGGGTTEIALYQQGGLKDLSVLPVGGDHITNDLAVGLRITFELAERLKIEHGCALANWLPTGMKLR